MTTADAQYILVQRDGAFEKTLDAKSVSKLELIDDQSTILGLADKLEERGVNVPFWPCKENGRYGFLVLGTSAQAREVSNILDGNFSAKPSNDRNAVSARSGSVNLSDAFGAVNGPLSHVASMRGPFAIAANNTNLPQPANRLSAPRLRAA